MSHAAPVYELRGAMQIVDSYECSVHTHYLTDGERMRASNVQAVERAMKELLAGVVVGAPKRPPRLRKRRYISLMRLSATLLALAALSCSGSGHVQGSSSSGTGAGASTSSSSSGTGGANSTTASTSSSASGGTGGTGGGASVPLPALPLHTSDRWILDANNKRFKLASVSWYGAEEQDYAPAGLEIADRHAIAKLIRGMGFNSVRLPWSNEMFELNPVVAAAVVKANPDLAGKHALDVLDAVVDALAEEGLVVILDNHTSDANWCCSATDGDGLWYTSGYPEASWLADWKAIVAHYQSRPAVVGAELRNELRPANGQTPTWGGSVPSLDWHAAAERGGNAVLGVNPNLLVVVQGLNYATDLTGPYTLPVKLAIDNRLVYAAHDYAWDHNGLASYADLKTALGNQWGYVLTQNKLYTAPVWVSEFGTCHTAATCVDDTTGGGFWFAGIRQYLTEADIDWAYWAINGTEARGTGRTFGAEETYGVLNVSWTGPALAELLGALQMIQPATQGP